MSSNDVLIWRCVSGLHSLYSWEFHNRCTYGTAFRLTSQIFLSLLLSSGTTRPCRKWPVVRPTVSLTNCGLDMGNTGSDLDPNLTKRKKHNDAGRKEGEGRKLEERETIDKGREEMRDMKEE